MFKNYRRKKIAQLRPVDGVDINEYQETGAIQIEKGRNVSISDKDKADGSPKEGDMIARNPEDHTDQWLVASAYFEENFEACK